MAFCKMNDAIEFSRKNVARKVFIDMSVNSEKQANMVPTFVYIKLMRDISKTCEICQMIKFDILAINKTTDEDQEKDRCEGCCVQEFRENLPKHFSKMHGIEDLVERQTAVSKKKFELLIS